MNEVHLRECRYFIAVTEIVDSRLAVARVK